MGQTRSVKTTLELPDALLRKAKASAARKGCSFRQLLQDALTEKLSRSEGARKLSKPWMTLAGGLKHLRSENRRIERLIEAEFETVESEDRA